MNYGLIKNIKYAKNLILLNISSPAIPIFFKYDLFAFRTIKLSVFPVLYQKCNPKAATGKPK
jgi:hypothetical protein